MKKLTVFFMAAVLMVAITQTAEAQQFKWKLQSTQPAGTPHIELLNKLSNNIEKMSAGRLKIEVLPAGAIVDAFHILHGVDKGVVEMGYGGPTTPSARARRPGCLPLRWAAQLPASISSTTWPGTCAGVGGIFMWSCIRKRCGPT